MRWSPYKKHRRLCRKCISFFFSHIRCFLGNKVNIPFIFTAFMPQSCFEFSRNPMNFTTSTSFNMKSMLVSLFSLSPHHSLTHTYTHQLLSSKRKLSKEKFDSQMSTRQWIFMYVHTARIHTYTAFRFIRASYSNMRNFNTGIHDKNGISFDKQNGLTFPVYLILYLTQYNFTFVITLRFM